MKNVIIHNFLCTLRNSKMGIGFPSVYSQHFSTSIAASQKKKKFYFVEVPEGLVPEPEPWKLSEEDKLLKSKRNVSGLQPNHYKKQHHQTPYYTEDKKEIMELWRYRRLYGMHGSASNIDLKALWPSVREMEIMKAREQVEFPHSVHEMIAMAKEKRLQEEMETTQRQQKIQDNMKKLEKWKKDVRSRIEKKELEAKSLLEVKEKQIEEVREILGYKISPYDPKFQEILEKKLEEDKKRLKKEKKLKRQQMELQRLLETAEKDATEADSSSTESLQGKVIK